VTICTSQKISEKSHPSTQLRQIDSIMENIPTKQMQLTCYIILLPNNIIQYLINFLGYCNARSLNQTCKLFHNCVSYEYLPHECVPPFTQVISYCDLKRLKNKEPILSELEGLIVDEMPQDSELINLIRDCCPKLKYLFIKYSCKCVYPSLCLNRLPCVRISIKINMLYMNCELEISLPSAIENFTAHISRIDPETLETIPDKYKGIIHLDINTFENLKSL
jgi:hypothetical protein